MLLLSLGALVASPLVANSVSLGSPAAELVHPATAVLVEPAVSSVLNVATTPNSGAHLANSVSLFETFTLSVVASRSYSAGATGDSASTDPNPWLHVRLNVYFDHPDLSEPIRVPGYFAGDGAGSDTGPVWRAHFTPAIEGTWTVATSLEGGQNLNAAPASVPGSRLETDPIEPLLEVLPVPAGAPGFRSLGFVRWDRRGQYYDYSVEGPDRFVQCGVGSPENFLGYAGFQDAQDGSSAGGEICCCRQACFDDCRRTVCQGSGDGAPSFLHQYTSHVTDWQPGDPDWSANGQDQQGRGIIGAINYLADDCGVNSMYMMLMNLGGDGKDTHPFLSNGGGGDCPMEGSNFDPGHTLNYHIARLEQWRTVFEHANDKGVMLQFFLAEQEACNIRWFGPHSSDGGPRNHMSLYRRLYMKQMVAHFGHLLGMRWNLCEENRSTATCANNASCGPAAAPMTPQFTAEELDEMADWITEWDAYEHPIGVHITPNDIRVYQELLALPEFPSWLTATSLQIHGEGGTGDVYEDVVQSTQQAFESAGFPMPIINDEQGTPGGGLSAEGNSNALPFSTADDRRRRVLYDVLLSGGQISYYFGYYSPADGGGDLRTEDFRTRDTALHQLGFAREIMESVQIWNHVDSDDLLTGGYPTSDFGAPEVSLTSDGSCAVIFYSGLGGNGGIASSGGDLDLRAFPGLTYRVQWFDPDRMTALANGPVLEGGQVVSIDLPDELTAPGSPYGRDSDLLLVLRAQAVTDTVLNGPAGLSR